MRNLMSAYLAGRGSRKVLRKVIATVAVTSTLALAACGGSDSGSASASDSEAGAGFDEVSLSYSDLTSATSGAGESVQRWIDEMDSESEGNVVIEPYWSSSLLTSAD